MADRSRDKSRDKSPGKSHDPRSLPELHGSVAVPMDPSWFRRLFAFAGPAYLVAVGYMDPGNWATDLQGGARFGYRLVWVLLMSNLMAVLLQTLSARLGVVTGKDLAQACRDWYPRAIVWPLWILCEVAIVACDLAEVLGAAIGLHMLFKIPLLWGVLITAGDVLLLLALSRLGMRRLEAIIIVLVATIGGCFALEMVFSRPDVPEILRHFIPRDPAGHPTLFPRGGVGPLGLDHQALYIAMGILGATVMPHNLYLHSSLVQTRAVERSVAGRRQAVRMNFIDSVVALNLAFFVNLAILVLAAAAFHSSGHQDVAKLEDAHRLLSPLLGTSIASTLFAVALLCSGQSSTITGTLAGQIVMEGFLRIRIRPWLRRLISRGLAIIPAVLLISIKGTSAVDDLLVLSQVVLSLQLSFAVIPLITFTSDRRKMGEFVSPKWVIALACLAAVLILSLNLNLATGEIGRWMNSSPAAGRLIWIVGPVIAVLALTLAYIVFSPLLERIWPERFRMDRLDEAGPVAAGSGRLAADMAAVAAPAGRAAPVLPLDAIYAAGHRHIAVALEMGGGDAAVLELLRTLPAQAGAHFTLMHVAESAASRYLGDESGDLEARSERRTLDALAESLRERGFRADVALGHGDAVDELARLVRESGAELLVVGSHGHRLVGDVVFGSTTSRLRHQVKCPVLIVPSAPKGDRAR